MTDFRFRIQAWFPVGLQLWLPEGVNPTRIAHPFPLTVQLYATEPRQSITIVGKGFASAEEAHDAGRQVQSALRVAGLRADVPIDLGKETRLAGVGPDERLAIEAALPVKVLDEVHGLQVYEVEEGSSGLVIGGSATPKISRPAVQLLDALKDSVTLSSLEDHLSLAVDLYFLAEFESSERARVLTLVTALEVAAEAGRSLRPAEERSIVESAMETAAILRDAADDDVEAVAADGPRVETGPRNPYVSLLSALKDLKKESIGASIRRLVQRHVSPDQTYLGQSPATFAGRCYGVRSKLGHRGEAGKEDLGRLRPELRRLVADVLKSCAGV